jgi:TPR repeat protein
MDLMVKISRMPRPEQESRMDLIWKNSSGSKTQRSDFTFCAGLAYLGNHMAQRCVGRAFEKGLGVVEDLSEAYTWYALALENPGADKTAEQQAAADMERVKMTLHSSYPAPSDDDLDDLIRNQKNRIEQSQNEVKKAKGN